MLLIREVYISYKTHNNIRIKRESQILDALSSPDQIKNVDYVFKNMFQYISRTFLKTGLISGGGAKQ